MSRAGPANRADLSHENLYFSIKSCNCRKKEYCPLNNQCLTNNVIYKAEIKNYFCEDTKEYIGNTAKDITKTLNGVCVCVCLFIW